MSEPPNNGPMDFADRYATVTRKMVNDAAQVAIDAVNKINDTDGTATKYTPGDAIRSATKLASIAITGGSALARISLQISPNSNARLIADEVTTVVARGLSDAAEVAGDVAEKLNAGTFRDQWVDSAITLTGMATLRTAEIAEAVAAGPGVLQDPRARFGPFTIDLGTATDEVVLKLHKLCRPDVEENIADLVCFEPAGGVVKAGTAGDDRHFWLTIDSTGVPSGIFRGEVEVFEKGRNRPIATVPVTVNL